MFFLAVSSNVVQHRSRIVTRRFSSSLFNGFPSAENGIPGAPKSVVASPFTRSWTLKAALLFGGTLADRLDAEFRKTHTMRPLHGGS